MELRGLYIIQLHLWGSHFGRFYAKSEIFNQIVLVLTQLQNQAVMDAKAKGSILPPSCDVLSHMTIIFTWKSMVKVEKCLLIGTVY